MILTFASNLLFFFFFSFVCRIQLPVTLFTSVGYGKKLLSFRYLGFPNAWTLIFVFIKIFLHFSCENPNGPPTGVIYRVPLNSRN